MLESPADLSTNTLSACLRDEYGLPSTQVSLGQQVAANGAIEINPIGSPTTAPRWAVSDTASSASRYSLATTWAPRDRDEAVERFQSLFGDGEIVDIALGSPI